MAQPIAPEVWNRAVKEKDPGLLPNKKTRELFKGNGGIQINPQGGVCRLWDMMISDYITDYDDRRINGLSGTNQDGKDGWGASAYGVFQNVYFDTQVFGMSRHRSLAYRLFEEYQYSGDIGQWGTATTSNYSSGGQALLAVAQQMNEVKSRVEEEVIGPDMDRYNMAMACNGKINGRVVCKPGYVDQVFDGDCSHFDWVAEPGPFGGTALPPRFAPIQCMELDFENVFPSLHNLRNAWAAVGIDSKKCVICIDPDYSLAIQQALTGRGIPILESTLKMMQDGPGDGFDINGFHFSFDVDTAMYPKVWVDANLNVVHSANGTAAYDKYINSVTPATTDRNPMRTRLIASHRMNVNNFVKTTWNASTKKFVKTVSNYPLGKTGAVDYYGEKKSWTFDQYDGFNTPDDYPHAHPGGGYGLPAESDLPAGSTVPHSTGPVAPIVKRRVVGLALYPQAVALSQEYSDMVTDEGRTRGKFTEMCWSIKYDCWVLPQYSLGVVPILDIDDTYEFTIPVTVKGATEITNAKDASGADKKFKTDATVSGTVNANATIKNTTSNPVPTREVTTVGKNK